MIQALIFDVGGVLLRTHDWSHRHKWDAKLGLAPGTAEETVFNSEFGTAAQLGQLTTDQHWQQLGQHFQLTTAALAQFRADFWAGDQFDHTIIDYVRTLRPRYQTAIISNAFDDLRAVLTDEFKVADAFDLIVVSAEENVMKPAAAIYERTLKRLNCPPEQAVFIDDSAKNIAGAQAVGLQTIHYVRDMDIAAALQKLGVQ